jgi:hypothetical protein
MERGITVGELVPGELIYLKSEPAVAPRQQERSSALPGPPSHTSKRIGNTDTAE